MFLRYPLRFIFSVLCILAIFPSLFAAGEMPFFGEINAKDINLRSDATTTSAVISTLNKGERVEVVLESYDWYKIRLPKNIPVYIRKHLTSCRKYADNSMPTTPTLRQCLSARVVKTRVNVRAKPGESAPIVGIADKNEIVNVISEVGSWYKIEPIQNSFGWVHKKFIDKSIPPAPPEVNESAVASQNKDSAAQDNPDNLTVFTGIVQPYGIVLMRSATHKLITQDNKTFLLKGNQASLNALNRQKVKVIGKIISPANAKYPIIEIKIIEVAN